jgi:RNA polymerase sigma factor (sigma-70 family)
MAQFCQQRKLGSRSGGVCKPSHFAVGSIFLPESDGNPDLVHHQLRGDRLEQNRREIVAWVAGQVLPHEGEVRAWLTRRGVAADQIDDVIQEAYCRIAALDDVRHIIDGRRYLFQTARNIVLEQIRHARVVRIDSVTEIDLLSIVDNEPTPERIASGRRELQRVRALIDGLPDRCRRIFELRRIEGVPQRKIAEMLKVTENVVEAQAVRGLKLILKALAEDTAEPGNRTGKHDERARDRTRH